MRGTLAATAILSMLCASACDQGRSTRRPSDDSLHLPRMGIGEFHGEETERPKEVRKTLPRTSPRTLQDALQKETEFAEHIVELWWASRTVHDDPAASRVPIVFDELRVQARSMDTPEPYAEALRFALCSLGDGHLRLLAEPGRTRDYFSGLHFDRAGDEILVSSRSTGSGKGAEPKPQPGDKLIAADGKPIAEWMDRLCLQSGSTPQHRHAVALASLRRQARYPHEQPTPREVTLQRASGETYTLSLGWRSLDSAPAGECVKASIVDKKRKIGVLRLRTFWCQDSDGHPSDLAFLEQLHAAAKALKKTQTVVVDLRGNTGGTDWAAKRVLGMLRGDTAVWTRQRVRHPYQATSRAEDIEHSPGPDDPVLSSAQLWVMIDAECSDTCELLVGALTHQEGVTTVGRATAGSVGTEATFRLPYTGLQIAVPITEHTLPGTQLTIEGRGIVPDIEVVRARSDIAAGTDADLDVVLDRIKD